MQQLCKSCRTCFMFYWMFYLTCDRSLRVWLLWMVGDDSIQRGTVINVIIISCRRAGLAANQTASKTCVSINVNVGRSRRINRFSSNLGYNHIKVTSLKLSKSPSIWPTHTRGVARNLFSGGITVLGRYKTNTHCGMSSITNLTSLLLHKKT